MRHLRGVVSAGAVHPVGGHTRPSALAQAVFSVAGSNLRFQFHLFGGDGLMRNPFFSVSFRAFPWFNCCCRVQLLLSGSLAAHDLANGQNSWSIR
jgi:hypothetical protein